MKPINERIWKYHNMGLSCPEIAKLTDLSTRTVQRCLKEERNTQPPAVRTRETKALELHREGLSYLQIARRLKVSKTTVYLWHRKHKANTSALVSG